MNESYKHSKVTKEIIRAFYKVYNTLGYGFLEKVYENAMYFELRKMGFFVERQKRIKVFYEEVEVGDYFADLIVNESVIVELKAAEALHIENEYQLINNKKGKLLYKIKNKRNRKCKIKNNKKNTKKK